MERNPDLNASILHYCVTGTAEWRVRLTALDLHESLAPEQQAEWGPNILEGHIRLLADAGLIEMKTPAGVVTIERVTWAGYEHLDAYQRSRLIRDNPFLR